MLDLVVMNFQGFGKSTKRSVVCRLTKWACKLSIVTCCVAGSSGDLRLEIQKQRYKNIHGSRLNRS